MKNAFYFTLKALLVLEIFKFLSWIFCQVVKHLDQKDTNSKFMMSPPGKQAIVGNKHSYCPVSQEVKAIRHWSLVSQQKITWETFFLKNQTPNVVENLFLDPFPKNQN